MKYFSTIKWRASDTFHNNNKQLHMSQFAEPSIFISYVFNTVSEAKITKVFENLGCGKIARVDIVNKGDHQSVYIHFSEWVDDEQSTAIREGLNQAQELQVVHDHYGHFWKIQKCRKREKMQHAKPYVVFGAAKEAAKEVHEEATESPAEKPKTVKKLKTKKAAAAEDEDDE